MDGAYRDREQARRGVVCSRDGRVQVPEQEREREAGAGKDDHELEEADRDQREPLPISRQFTALRSVIWTHGRDDPDGGRVAVQAHELDRRSFVHAGPVLERDPDEQRRAERVHVHDRRRCAEPCKVVRVRRAVQVRADRARERRSQEERKDERRRYPEWPCSQLDVGLFCFLKSDNARTVQVGHA